MAENEQTSNSNKSTEFQSLLDSNINRPVQPDSLQKEKTNAEITNSGMNQR